MPTPKRSLSCEIVVGDDYDYVWAGIPKVASRTLLYVLYRDRSSPIRGIKTVQEYPSFVRAHPYVDKFFKFSFCRNPWARVVSCYNSKVKKPSRKVIEKVLRTYPVRAGMPFEEFVEYLCSDIGQDRYSNPHWVSQNLFLRREGEWLVDYVGIFEDLQVSFDAIVKHLGFEETISLPTINSTDPKVLDTGYWRGYYDQRLKSLVAERYKEDIRLFGYRFDPLCVVY